MCVVYRSQDWHLETKLGDVSNILSTRKVWSWTNQSLTQVSRTYKLCVLLTFKVEINRSNLPGCEK